jgi:hypothetical protein
LYVSRLYCDGVCKLTDKLLHKAFTYNRETSPLSVKGPWMQSLQPFRDLIVPHLLWHGTSVSFQLRFISNKDCWLINWDFTVLADWIFQQYNGDHERDEIHMAAVEIGTKVYYFYYVNWLIWLVRIRSRVKLYFSDIDLKLTCVTKDRARTVMPLWCHKDMTLCLCDVIIVCHHTKAVEILCR